MEQLGNVQSTIVSEKVILSGADIDLHSCGARTDVPVGVVVSRGCEDIDVDANAQEASNISISQPDNDLDIMVYS